MTRNEVLEKIQEHLAGLSNMIECLKMIPTEFTNEDTSLLKGDVLEEEVESGEGEGLVSKEELYEEFSKMGIKQIRARAEELGINHLGKTKPKIIVEIIESLATKETVEGEGPEEKDIEEENIDEEAESKVEEVTLYDRIVKETADMSTEDIKELLVENGVKKTKGKRESLIQSLVEAVEAGIIVLEDDGEEQDSEEEAKEDSEVKEDSEITPERAEGLKNLEEKIKEEFGDKLKKSDRKELIEILKEFYGEVASEDYSAMSDEDILQSYYNVLANFIGDDGENYACEEEEDQPEVYTINSAPYCCGYPLKYVEEDNTLVCKVCGAEYEAGEEDE